MTAVDPEQINDFLGLSSLALPTQVTKRNGTTVEFDILRIEKAIAGCWSDFQEEPATPVFRVVQAAGFIIAKRFQNIAPTVEDIQDCVEAALVSVGEFDAARNYMSYRDQRAKERNLVPAEVQAMFDQSGVYFPQAIQQFQYFDKYSRFNWDLGRRETWMETVSRVVEYLRWLVDSINKELPESIWVLIEESILDQEAMPSMRALAMAGEPAKRNSLAIYNCSAQPVDSIEAFVEAMLISMAGCGVGYSIERQYVEQFPRIQRQVKSGVTVEVDIMQSRITPQGVVEEPSLVASAYTGGSPTRYVIHDSSTGWAEALRFGLTEWFAGRDVTFEYGYIREAGTPLKVKGGRASGPEPLRFVLDFCRSLILKRQGSFLRTLDAHDMMCVVGGAAVSGGVRRTAMIALYSWDDHEMRDCKAGAIPDYRWNANNSAVWPDGLNQIEVTDQMMAMIREGRGEPGIFSRANAIRTKPERRKEADFLTNPCGEINLRPRGLCNLTIAVARPGDTEDDLMRKVEVATIIGTIQSLAVTFPGMRQDWVDNCIDERLLGVDITGQADCPLLDKVTVEGAMLRESLKEHAIRVNDDLARLLGVNPSAAITCDKPSGNSSLLLNTASGLHRRWSAFYVRRCRVNTSTPIYKVLRDAGVPLSPENGSSVLNASTWVASFPIKSPEGALTRKDLSAVEQCEFWLLNKVHWTEHNPSVTITYQEDEILALIQWVWDHKDLIGGMAFLPADDAGYAQAPYEEITEEEYERLAAEFPVIDYSLLYAHEQTDMTDAAAVVACGAGGVDC